MKKLFKILFAGIALLYQAAFADIVVQVHGYLGSGQSWDFSGINAELGKQGWQKAGNVFYTPDGSMLLQYTQDAGSKLIYSVELPSKAPVMLQADLLQQMISDLEKRHPNEKITLIGHSAGGIVARLKLVRFGPGNVTRLITIASPHLGTSLAAYALDETTDPLPINFIKSFFGGDTYHTAKSSKALLVDLVPVRPGTALFWLNNQPHPPIEYVSIVRGEGPHRSGDRVIPGYSQDMNQVPALHGQSSVYYLPTTHFLNPLDGGFLSQLLESQSH